MDAADMNAVRPAPTPAVATAAPARTPSPPSPSDPAAAQHLQSGGSGTSLSPGSCANDTQQAAAAAADANAAPAPDAEMAACNVGGEQADLATVHPAVPQDAVCDAAVRQRQLSSTPAVPAAAAAVPGAVCGRSSGAGAQPRGPTRAGSINLGTAECPLSLSLLTRMHKALLRAAAAMKWYDDMLGKQQGAIQATRAQLRAQQQQHDKLMRVGDGALLRLGCDLLPGAWVWGTGRACRQLLQLLWLAVLCLWCDVVPCWLLQ